MMTRMSAPTDTRLLSIEEAAERLSCSKPHVYRLIRASALRAVDISEPSSKRSKTRVRSDDLQSYIEDGSWDAKAHADSPAPIS